MQLGMMTYQRKIWSQQHRSNRSRRRISSSEAAKVVTMGGDQSKPINAKIERKIEAGEDKVRSEVGDVR